MLIAGLTAALVFLVARALLPLPHASRAPQPVTPVSSVPAPAPIDAMGAIDGASADGAEAGAGLDATDERTAAALAEIAAAAGNPGGVPDDAAARSSPDGPHADKDVARTAWRANWPEIRVQGPRASIIIPLKGSSEGATYKYFSKTNALAIVLPHAASLNTMHYYRLGPGGFKALWTFQDENNALPESGTKMRIKLAFSALPQVEFYDDYVKVTIRRPPDSE